MPSRILLAKFLAAAVVTAAGGVWANPDTFCIGENEDGSSYYGCLSAPPFVTTNIYLCLRNLSGNQVLSWEARVTHDNAASMIGVWVVDGLDSDPDPEDFVVDCSHAPLFPNPQNTVVLGVMQVLVLNPDDPINFFVGPVPGSINFPDGTPGYVHTAGINTPADVCGPGYDYPVFRINSCIIDEVKDAAWSEIKRLYGQRTH